MKMNKTKKDFFENLADSFNTSRKKILSKNLPREFEKKICIVDKEDFVPVTPPHKMTTKEELYEVLGKMRAKYEPFLKDYAPALTQYKTVHELKNFVFNGKEKITLPHYGGPVGNTENTYEANFEISEDLTGKAVYICFGGADYEAGVYINDYHVGSHEGFFSPFEFEITNHVKNGINSVKINLKNDYPHMGYVKDGVRIFGDKLYAATGLGWDDSELGWHHCPPGMGIYNYVRIEIRNRVNISDLYIRPLLDDKKAEIWITVENPDYIEKAVTFSLSVYGQNFREEVMKNYIFDPYFCYEQERIVNEDERSSNSFSLTAAHGSNIYKILVDMDDIKIWNPETPYLYQAQVSVIHDGMVCDAKKQQFGMRSFVQDTHSTPKGKFYLNGRNIKLRGANTMGFEQQDVLRGDYDQLIDDILLSKICNMNFWRLTQRPVQDEVYEYCDKLGLMTQSDLPLFNCVRRTEFAEVIRQAEEMAKIVRKHPCNVIVSYINEPTAFGWCKPHRNLIRTELEDMFECCNKILHLNHPDCVVKHVDGDYDAPTKNSISDIHCYNLWYNGHVIDFGKLHKGFWADTDRDWCTGCGEFGAEGLDCVDLMKRRYPKDWIKEPFSPANILCAQSMGSHGNFYDTPGTMEEWVDASWEHQAFTAKYMTESFRRNPDMITYAIHLFIDAWPAGWMKTIMDCERTPKKAYFAYRDACAPILITLRSDRFTYYEGEEISVETYVCNDMDEEYKNFAVAYELFKDGKPYKGASIPCNLRACDVDYIANAQFSIDKVTDREKFVLKAYLIDNAGNTVSQNEFPFEVFADVEVPCSDNIVIIDSLEPGTHTVAGEEVTVYGGRRLHFVSRASGHKAVEDFEKNDFKFWYNKAEDRITTLTDRSFRASGFTPILTSNNSSFNDENGCPEKQFVVAEKFCDGKRYIVSTLDLREENPVAKRFKKAIYEL